MIKCYNTLEGFQEIPGEVSLLLNISNCQQECVNCHTPILREDVGEEVTKELIDFWISQGPFTCVCFMGEGNHRKWITRHTMKELLNHVERRGLKSAVYSGRNIHFIDWVFEYETKPDYLKLGSYNEELGPLNKETTNQRLYCCVNPGRRYEDITSKFWRKKI